MGGSLDPILFWHFLSKIAIFAKFSKADSWQIFQKIENFRFKKMQIFSKFFRDKNNFFKLDGQLSKKWKIFWWKIGQNRWFFGQKSIFQNTQILQILGVGGRKFAIRLTGTPRSQKLTDFWPKFFRFCSEPTGSAQFRALTFQKPENFRSVAVRKSVQKLEIFGFRRSKNPRFLEILAQLGRPKTPKTT